MKLFKIFTIITIASMAIIANADPKINVSELETPVRDAEGFYLRASKAEAQSYCKGLNKSLPTFEEWLKYAVLHGARGLLDHEDGDNLFSQTYKTVNNTYIYS